MDIESIRHSFGKSDNHLPDIWHTLETLEQTCEDLDPKIDVFVKEIVLLRKQIYDSTWNISGCEKLSELEIVSKQSELAKKEERLRVFRSTQEAARVLIYYYRFKAKDSDSVSC